MKKAILIIFGVGILNLPAWATEITYETCTDCPSCGTNCKYTLNNGKLIVYGPTEKNSDNTIDEGSIRNGAFIIGGQSIETVDIKGNITTIGADAFFRCGNITEVTFSDSVKTIGNAERYSENGVFNSSKLAVLNFGPNSQLETIGYSAFRNMVPTQPIVIPATVKNIGGLAFYSDFVRSTTPFVIEGVPENIDYYANFSCAKIYCRAAFEACTNLSNNPTYFTKTDEGLYVLTDEQGQIGENPTYFISANLMALDKNGEKGCKSISECQEIINAANQNKSFIAGGKFYASLSDWANGIYEKKRIYTVQEATKASAPTGNRVSIKYR